MLNQLAAGASPLRRRLLPGERVLWEGRPDRRAFMFGGSLLLIPFTVLWCAFAIFWEVVIIAGGAPPLFVLWGVPFVLVGLYMVAGRFFVAAREANRTWYAVTDRRVMIEREAFRSRYTELDLVSLPAPELDEGARAIGTITFGPTYPGLRMVGPSWPGVRMGPALVAIEDAGRVFRTIADARAAALGQPARAS